VGREERETSARLDFSPPFFLSLSLSLSFSEINYLQSYFLIPCLSPLYSCSSVHCTAAPRFSLLAYKLKVVQQQLNYLPPLPPSSMTLFSSASLASEVARNCFFNG
jgi:hypothetical protein